jgi:hypothetical protein
VYNRSRRNSHLIILFKLGYKSIPKGHNHYQLYGLDPVGPLWPLNLIQPCQDFYYLEEDVAKSTAFDSITFFVNAAANFPVILYFYI